MGVTTAVDPSALEAAAARVSCWSDDVLRGVQSSGPMLARVAVEVSGSQSSGSIEAARAAMDEALNDLGWSLHCLAGGLTRAAGTYRAVEAFTTSTFRPADPGTFSGVGGEGGASRSGRAS